MKYIKLTRNKQTIVDDEDFEYLNRWKWYCDFDGYAIRDTCIKGMKKHIFMHRLINKTPKGFHTDHKNGNPSDNRKKNLRTATSSDNSINRGLQSNNTSGFKGISWYANAWNVEIKIMQKKIYLGRFKDIKDAIITRKKAELLYHAKNGKLICNVV